MPRSSFRLLLAVAVAVPVACARHPGQGGSESAPATQPASPASPDAPSQVLRARLAAPQPSFAPRDPSGADTWAAVRRLYESNGYEPIWTVNGKPRPEVHVLQDAMRHAADEGLDSSAYDVGPASTLLASHSGGLFKRDHGDSAAVVDADVRLSYAFLKFGAHLQRGRVPPGQVDKHWFGHQREEDLVQILKTALESGKMAETLERLKPQHPQYAALKKALARYREVAAKGGWGTLPAGFNLRPGRPDPQVAALRAHLIATGDLPPSAAAAPAPAAPSSPTPSPSTSVAAHGGPVAAPTGPVFDAETQDALKRFERRHGFVADGRLDRVTLAALNVPVEERIRQIELNLERWRWLPATFGDRYVLVNIPTFHLTAVEHGQVALQMRVVTGKHDSPTPIFSDDMTTIVFSPFWNVPPEIARNETIPAAMRDPGYLGRNSLEAVRGSHVVDPWNVDWSNPGRVQLRQRPGSHNALGQVKFLFPNQFDVYLHDTPADALFARVERDYSHGCVRVEKPFELAQWVLKDRPEWTPEKIKAAMDSGREQQVALKQHIPVYILYETVWVDDDGTVGFRDDVYGHDARQRAILSGGTVNPVQVAGGASPAAPPARSTAVPRLADATRVH